MPRVGSGSGGGCWRPSRTGRAGSGSPRYGSRRTRRFRKRSPCTAAPATGTWRRSTPTRMPRIGSRSDSDERGRHAHGRGARPPHDLLPETRLSISGLLVRRQQEGRGSTTTRKGQPMRKYMTIVKGSEHHAPPPPALFEAIDKLMKDAGKRLVGVGGLLSSDKGARARLAKGKITVTDGPFTEAKEEVIGGFAIYEVSSLAEAKQWTRRFLDLHVEHFPGWDC